MQNSLRRIFALLLIPCLVINAVPTAAFSPAPVHALINAPLFKAQALSLDPIAAFHEASNRWAAGLMRFLFGWQPATGWLDYEPVERNDSGNNLPGILLAKNKSESSGSSKPAAKPIKKEEKLNVPRAFI